MEFACISGTRNTSTKHAFTQDLKTNTSIDSQNVPVPDPINKTNMTTTHESIQKKTCYHKTILIPMVKDPGGPRSGPEARRPGVLTASNAVNWHICNVAISILQQIYVMRTWDVMSF